MARKTEGESVGLAQFRDAMRDGDWQNLRSIKTDRNGRELEMYAKNGRLLIVQSFGESGFEVFYPSSAQKITDVIDEANRFAVAGQVRIGDAPPVYIIRRDGDEIDVFSDHELAAKWGAHVGAEVEEEGVIDEATLKTMIDAQRGESLRSSVEDAETEVAILDAARSMFPGRELDVFFEHDHYWLRVKPIVRDFVRTSSSRFDDSADDSDRTFDVVDAVPGVAGSGFDFEEVS